MKAKYNQKFVIDCKNMTQEDIDELYHQISLKISPSNATMMKVYEE